MAMMMEMTMVTLGMQAFGTGVLLGVLVLVVASRMMAVVLRVGRSPLREATGAAGGRAPGDKSVASPAAGATHPWAAVKHGQHRGKP